MRVRPIFLVLLCLAVLAGALALALGAGKSRYERFEAAVLAEQKAQQSQLAAGRPYLPQTIAALDSLKLRPNVHGLTTHCTTGYVRCYLVAQPPNVVAPGFPRLLRGIGADLDSWLAGDRAYQRAAQAEGLTPTSVVNPNGCDSNRYRTWAVVCHYIAILDHNEIAAVLGPYLPCDPSCVHARFTGQTEILITVPGASPAGSP